MLPTLIVMLILAIVALQLFASAGYSYHLRDDGLHLRAGGLFTKKIIRYEQVEEARRATIGDFLLAQHYGLTVRNAILLRLNTGLWRLAVITPPDPETFLRELRDRISSCRRLSSK